MAISTEAVNPTTVFMTQPGEENVQPYGDLLATIASASYSFLQPTTELNADAINAVKSLLDPLAADIADAQTVRREENRKKRKRGESEQEDAVLQLRQVYTNGLGVRQVWEQARRVLEAACTEIERDCDEITQLRESATVVSNNSDSESAHGSDSEGIEDVGLEDDVDDNEIEHSEEPEVEDAEVDSEDEEEDIEELEEDELGTHDDAIKNTDTYIEDPNGLNDGFFSIDEFNKQTQFLEQQDARGEDDNPSDEDEIDWAADPLSMPFAAPTQSLQDQDMNENEDEEDEDDEGGPTFDDVDSDASDDQQDDFDDADLDNGMSGLSNTNDIKYSEFFEPPPKKLSKTKRMRALPKTQPPKKVAIDADELENDIQRAISDVNRDLFDDEESDEDSDQSEAGIKGKNLSTHEKQRAAIAAEIRRLEAANVAKKDWALLGEARAAERPINSLIEEDLEFERVGKPVPVITAEVTEEIEQLIKRRIIAREFDEVIRRRPDAIGSASETRRGRVEVDDTKPRTGLADVYEQEHLKSTDPGYVDQRSAATKRQHEEIDRLWKDVSSQLDLLSNLHFKPKRVELDIKTVEDKPTISMEDARPVGIGGQDSMLAPQEIYKPGEEGKISGEVTKKSGASVSKEEMTREEKLRKRRREKERLRKANGNKAGSVATADEGVQKGKKNKNQEQQDILTELRKGNVKVIGKRGELQDLSKQKRTHADGQSSSALKL